MKKFKRILVLAMCVVFVLGMSTMAFAAKKKAKAEPLDSLKEMISIAYSTGGDAMLRMWLTNSIGLDMQANLGYAQETFNLGIGAGIVFPVMEEGKVNVYVVPGMSLGLAASTASVVSFGFFADIEAEAFIVKNLISVAGRFGLNLGIVAMPDPIGTSFDMNVGTSPAKLMMRIYI